MSPPGYDVAVRAWAEHLRSGGTTPWSAWLSGTRPAPAHPTAHHQAPAHLPNAIHLELLRRLNAHGSSDPGLADRLLETGPAGRGRVDPPLPWPGAPHRFGTPPIDPEQLPAEELLRLAVSLVARLLPGVRGNAPATPASRWPIPGRRRFRLHGSPRSVARLRTSLLAQGLVESDWRPVHVVVGRPVEVMLGEHWAEGSRHGGSVALDAVWRRARAASRLPRSLDLPRLAASISERVGDSTSERVHVVVGRDLAHVQHLVARLLDIREEPVNDLPGPDPTTADLLRRLNRLLALTAGPDRVQALAATLEHVVLAGVDRPEAAYPAPVRALPWADDLAGALAEDLRGADYAVHGRLEDLRPDRRAPRRLDPTNTLDLALSACLRAWQLQGGT